MSPSRSVTRSTCQPCSGPTTRQAPNAPDSSKAKPPVARAIALAASRGSSSSATSTSSVGRPSNWSRTAPPTSHASRPASTFARGFERRPHRYSLGTRAEIPQVTS